jgi:hypothetical protein
VVREIGLAESLGMGNSARLWGRPQRRLRNLPVLSSQGSRGKSALKWTFGPDGQDSDDKGVWMSIWVDGVDIIHQHCLKQGLEVTWPPTDMPWGVREIHVRHPDGHIFRISRAGV